MNCPVEAVILAAGLSTRMGASKLLLRLEGIPLLMWVVGAALESKLKRLIVVVGPKKREFTHSVPQLDGHPKVDLVINPHPERGMSSSVRVGIGAVGSDAAGAMILLGDQPGVTPALLDELLMTFRNDPDETSRHPWNREHRLRELWFPDW